MINETLYYRATLDQMTPVMIQALIDTRDMGNGMCWAEHQWVINALVRLELVISTVEYIHRERTGEPANRVTPYGERWLAWYRQPHDVPVQMDLFGVDTP